MGGGGESRFDRYIEKSPLGRTNGHFLFEFVNAKRGTSGEWIPSIHRNRMWQDNDKARKQKEKLRGILGNKGKVRGILVKTSILTDEMSEFVSIIV